MRKGRILTARVSLLAIPQGKKSRQTAMPPIGQYARFTRDGSAKLYRAIRRATGKLYRAIRERSAVLAVTVAFTCLPVYALVWYLHVYNNIAHNITVTVVVTALPVTTLLSPPEPLTARSYPVSLAVLSLIALIYFIGDEFDSQLITFNVTLLVLALPYGLLYVIIVRREWLVSVGLVLALLATMIYWGAALAINKEGFHLVLLPLPIILAGGVLWAPLASWTLKCARRHRNRKISGPGTQVLAMTMLFCPVTLVAVALPPDLGLGEMWSNVSLALIGLFLSGVISEPLRRMLIEWGKLAPYRD